VDAVPPVLLRRARLFGADAPVDVLLRDGRVAALAPRLPEEPGAETVDLDGRVVVPGMWDGHVHFTQWVVRRGRFDLAGTRSAADVLEVTRAHLAATPARPGEVLVGYGFRDALWPDAPTRAALDEVAAGRPVVLISGDLHCGWVSAAAAGVLHLDDAALGATGVVREFPWIAALRHLDERPSSAAYREAADAAARRGVVGVVEFENADNLAEWPERVAAGVTALRVETSVWPDRLEAAIAAGLRTGDVLDAAGLITMGRLKIVADGSLNTRTGYCWDPYPGADPGAADAYGIASVPASEVRRLLARAHANGLQASVHAIGDRAASEALDAIEEVGIPATMEHAQLLRDADLPRFAQLGVVASVQPEHAMDDRDVADRHWAGRTGGAFAFGSLRAAGAELRLGSDAPVAPLDPWQAIASAVLRTRDDRAPWHPEQRIPLDAAIAASTRGRVTPALGDVADLAVLDDDPATADRDALRAMPVAATLLGGRFTWRGL
jgi:predicted amidohydrolase YtcJ